MILNIEMNQGDSDEKTVVLRALEECMNEHKDIVESITVIDGDTVKRVFGDDKDTYNMRREYVERFKRSYVATLEPMSEMAEDEVEWHISDVLWATDVCADVLGKKQLQDILWHLFSSEEYWRQ